MLVPFAPYNAQVSLEVALHVQTLFSPLFAPSSLPWVEVAVVGSCWNQGRPMVVVQHHIDQELLGEAMMWACILHSQVSPYDKLRVHRDTPGTWDQRMGRAQLERLPKLRHSGGIPVQALNIRDEAMGAVLLLERTYRRTFHHNCDNDASTAWMRRIVDNAHTRHNRQVAIWVFLPLQWH